MPFGDVVGTWMVFGSTINFPTVVTFTANPNGQFTSGTFTWEETDTLNGQVITVQGTYVVDHRTPLGGLLDLTLFSAGGAIIFQGIYAQPGPGEFIIEEFANLPLGGGPSFYSFIRL